MAVQDRSDSDARFTRRVGLFSAGTLISRILGLVRESVFAYLFGVGSATDAFNVAFRIPNFFRDLFAESALSAAFVPAFVESLDHKEKKQTWLFAANMLNTLALVVGFLVIVGIVFAPQITRIVALGFAHDPAKIQLTTTLTRIMFPFLLFVVFAAWAMGILNASGTFFTPAVAPAAFNAISILVPLLAYGFFKARGLNPILGMAGGVTLGSIAQFVVQIPRLRRYGFRYRPVLNFKNPQLRRVFLRWVPMVLGFATWQVNFLINTFLLTFLPQGSVTWVNYAYRIQHLPAGLFGAAIGSVALAAYSHQAAGQPASAIQERFKHAMGLVVTLTLPAAVLLFVLALPVVRLIYQHGRFTPQDTVLTSQALMLYCLGIWAAAATRNCAAGFYSLGNTKTPALVAIGVVSFNIIMNLILMRYIGFRSFPFAASVAQFLNFGVLFVLLRRKTGGLHGKYLGRLTLAVLAAAIGAGLVAYVTSRFYESLITPTRIWTQAGQVLFAGGLGLGAYYLLGRAFRIKEVHMAFIHLLGRLTRPKS